ncbi:MAG: hypothetical protein M4579_005548 [Chaenotheca gracillima]|nr:MAG: hypothetical protein M4579_005548 [Chaenotheca gracillima]
MSSIFSKFRTGKQVASRQQAQMPKEDQSDASKTKPTPYRHVPSHARMDAMIGAPSCYVEQDREKIRAQKRRRSSQDVPGRSSPSKQRSSSYYGNPWSERGEIRVRDPKMRRGDSGVKRSPLSSVETSSHISEEDSSKSTSSREDLGEGSQSSSSTMMTAATTTTATATTSNRHQARLILEGKAVRQPKPTTKFNDVVTITHLPDEEYGQDDELHEMPRLTALSVPVTPTIVESGKKNDPSSKMIEKKRKWSFTGWKRQSQTMPRVGAVMA